MGNLTQQFYEKYKTAPISSTSQLLAKAKDFLIDEKSKLNQRSYSELEKHQKMFDEAIKLLEQIETELKNNPKLIALNKQMELIAEQKVELKKQQTELAGIDPKIKSLEKKLTDGKKEIDEFEKQINAESKIIKELEKSPLSKQQKEDLQLRKEVWIANVSALRNMEKNLREKVAPEIADKILKLQTEKTKLNTAIQKRESDISDSENKLKEPKSEVDKEFQKSFDKLYTQKRKMFVGHDLGEFMDMTIRPKPGPELRQTISPNRNKK